MSGLRLILRAILTAVLTIPAAAQSLPIVVDTDAGSDDFMAIAFLLAHPAVKIEAITVSCGLAHVDAGARNLVRLLAASGRAGIPVFPGRSVPLRGSAEFPAEWRKISDDLPGVALPTASRKPQSKPAADYLVERLRDKRRPVRILALGPLTNLAEALDREPSIAGTIQELVIMGGAVLVPGNLGDGRLFKTNNTTAEWNIFIDPFAARIVFRSGVPIRMVGLDATNKVPIGLDFLRKFQSAAVSPLGRVVAQVLEADREAIEGKYFYAWDPLAAVALLYPRVLREAPMHLDILQDPPEAGRTARTPGTANARVAVDADSSTFRKLFTQAFEK